jgi:hypothetical protein
MGYDEQLNQVERYDGLSGSSLRERMTQLLMLREQVRLAEANRKKRFSIVEGIHEAKLTSSRPTVAIELGKVARGR